MGIGSSGTSRPWVRPVLVVLVVLAVVSGIATNGLGGGLLALGLVALLVGVGALWLGRARWAFVASRGMGAAVLAAGMALAVVGGATASPTPLRDASTEQAAAETAATDDPAEDVDAAAPATGAVAAAGPTTALAALATVEVKGRAPRTGYARDQFGAAWTDTDRNGCDTRNDVLARDLTGETFKPGTRDCVVTTGTLADPYSGRTIAFVRGQGTSEAVQIDHVVALSDAWQKGAQQWDTVTRTAFANDRLNLLAVDGPLNQQKSDGDAATWLPPSTGYRCAYVARQVAVKVSYGLWMTAAERNAIATILTTCPNEPLPGGVVANVAVPSAVPSTSAPSATPAPAPRTSSSPAPQAAPDPLPAPVPVPVPAPAPEPAPEPEAPSGVYYENCAAARAAGAAPVRVGDPGYRAGLDRDGDGVGCE